MKTHFNDFIIEGNNMDKEMRHKIINKLPINKQVTLLVRGDKIMIRSNSINREWLNLPMTFIKFNKLNDTIYAFDFIDNIYKIVIEQPIDDRYTLEIL